MIQKTIEPQIEIIVDRLNNILSKNNLRAGIEVSWFFDEIDQEVDQ